ncbi:MAG: Type restriction enzyme protein terminus [Ignavibacteria bacterium]|nr:Type restriction enzyme protein terminus [Ignavibacteria bacterium]
MLDSSWLRDYFKKLSENILNSEISSESALTATVEFPLSGWGKSKSLLQALGYNKANVQQQFAVKGIGTAKPRVDFLIGDKPNHWMLELKKPSDICERPKYVEQLQSYMVQENIAMGILFNGRQALAYVNPEHSCIINICNNIKEEEISVIPDLNLKLCPIRKANIISSDIKEMVTFFRQFRYDEKLLDIQALAFNLTDQYVRKLRQDAKLAIRNNAIRTALNEIFNNPDELILDAIIKASKSLSDIKTKPNELLNIWKNISFITESETNKNNSPNNIGSNHLK